MSCIEVTLEKFGFQVPYIHRFRMVPPSHAGQEHRTLHDDLATEKSKNRCEIYILYGNV